MKWLIDIVSHILLVSDWNEDFKGSSTILYIVINYTRVFKDSMSVIDSILTNVSIYGLVSGEIETCVSENEIYEKARTWNCVD